MGAPKLSLVTLLVLALATPGLCEESATSAPAALVLHMHEHLDAMTKIKTAIINGELDAVREPARWLAEHETPSAIPAAWFSHVEAMRSNAHAAQNAANIKAAARAASKMAGACGSCHQANGIIDRFPDVEAPGDEAGTIAHMLRHQWAADRMWEGLIGPSDKAWDAGTNLLLEVPLASRDLDSSDPRSREHSAMARRIHGLAASGMIEDSFAGRVDIYADFLSACAACHSQVRPVRR